MEHGHHGSATSRLYDISRTAFSHHYSIKGTRGSNESFYLDSSTWTPGKANLTLHSGTTSSGPVLAVCHFPKFSRDLKVGLGDPSASKHDSDVRWEDVQRNSAIGGSRGYSLSAVLRSGERRPLEWRHTHHVAVDGGSASSLGGKNWKLVDAGTSKGEPYAVFTGDRGLCHCGALQINGDEGREFEMLVLMSFLGMYEKLRRARAGAAAAGGAAAGS